MNICMQLCKGWGSLILRKLLDFILLLLAQAWMLLMGGGVTGAGVTDQL